MASQQGFEYEKNAAAYLYAKGFSPTTNGAGASSNRPDIMLSVHGEKSGCELKISPTAGGSLVLKYYSKKTPHWQFGEVDHDKTEKVFLSELATRSGVLQAVNSKWTIPPFLIEDRDKRHEQIMLQVPLRERYKADLKTCPDEKIPLESSAMSKYYNLKETYYMNIGTHGFFLLGNTDPLGLNDNLRKKNKPIAPTFESVAKITARVRCQSKGVTKADAAEKSKGQIGAQGYQFTFTLEFSLATNSSPYNIAPLASGGKSVTILSGKDALLNCFR
jgi:hypothetical protein